MSWLHKKEKLNFFQCGTQIVTATSLEGLPYATLPVRDNEFKETKTECQKELFVPHADFLGVSCRENQRTLK
jgi:hypothetical protein